MCPHKLGCTVWLAVPPHPPALALPLPAAAPCRGAFPSSVFLEVYIDGGFVTGGAARRPPASWLCLQDVALHCAAD